MTPPDGSLLAVDGGGSKVDAALLSSDGDVLRAVRLAKRVPGGDPSDENLEAISAAVGRILASDEGRERPRVGVFCLAGADLPQDEHRIERWLSDRRWADDAVLRNDTFAVLRAGTERAWGVGIVCGFGTNCSARSPDGRVYRLPALGQLSGDWGGGTDIGEAALWYAVRAEDGRGEPTSLASIVPTHFGMRRSHDVMEAMYVEQVAADRVSELVPAVFAAAGDGDAVARSIVDRQADEIVTMAGAAIRALGIQSLDVDVVLGGGIFRNDLRAFFDRIRNGVERTAPRARIVVLAAPPVVGAAMLALDHVYAGAPAYARVRHRLTHDVLEETLTTPVGNGS
jgi:N-acetylglucosamine kinase-like BadF-type ATPase